MSSTARVGVIALIMAVFVFAIGWLFFRNMKGGSSPAPQVPVADRETSMRTRGAYLMAISGCNDCHSPRDQSGKLIPGREMTGHPEGAPAASWDPSLLDRGILFTISPTGTSIAGPHGVSYASNLTPDMETGIGSLTADALIQSWRTGKHWQEDRPILPLMPFEAYACMTDDDIRALHAFLMSLPPTRNKVPGPTIAPPPPTKG